MDEYAKMCIQWLIENDRALLTQYVNTISGSNVSIAKMDVNEVEIVLLNATHGSTKREKTGIRCNNCKKNTVIFYEVQSRSADEGASVFYSCTSCLIQWKQR